MNAISTMISKESKSNLRVIKDRLPSNGKIIFRKYMEAADRLKSAGISGLKLIFTRKGRLKFFEGVSIEMNHEKKHYYSCILNDDQIVIFVPSTKDYQEFTIEQIIQKYKSWEK